LRKEFAMANYKILWQAATVVSKLPDYVKAIKGHSQRILGPEITLDIRGVDVGTMDLHFAYFQYLNDHNLLHSVLRASREGYDGVAVGCICDSGVHLAREVTDIPIAGLAESGMLFACMYGKKFSIVTYTKELIDKRLEALIRLYGLEERAAELEYFEVSLEAIANAFKEPGPVLDAFKLAAQRAVDKGAEVILPGCGILNLLSVQNGLTKVGSAPVLDVSGVLMKTLETMITLKEKSGITVSRRGLYASPSKEQIEAAKKIYSVDW
jgi:allantoin racemase